MVRNITRPLAHLTRETEGMSKLGNELLAFSCADMKSNTVKLEKIALLPAGQAAVKRKTTTADGGQPPCPARTAHPRMA